MARRDDERELQELLTAVASMVLLGLVVLIVVVVLFLPARQETTLILGLMASVVGAMVPLLRGLSLTIRGSSDKDKEE